MKNLIDAHIHLTHEKYDKIEEVISEAKAKGMKKIIVIGCDEQEIKKSLKLVKEHQGFLYLAIGFHPVDIENLTEEKLLWVEELCQTNEQIVAVGEIGLDYHWYPEQKEQQKYWFKKQINLARKLNKPIIIHARESYDDCYEILQEENYFYGVMHSFADDYTSAKRFLDKGMYLSISGPLTFKNGHNQKEVIKNMDLNRLLVETDGPYLTPVPFRGKVNYPWYVQYILEEIALIKEMPYQEVVNLVETNTYQIFKEMKDEKIWANSLC
ncbi:MAG: TatD family hydrolase [Mycoplasmatales bacterium]